MTSGTLLEIWTSPSNGADMVGHDSIEAIADLGLTGDRYAAGHGTYSKLGLHPDRQLTLIEQEQLDWLHDTHGISMSGAHSRRNLLVRGIALNDLVGKRIRIGDIEVEGIRLCQPCKPLSEVLGFDFVHLMLNRSGLNCRIVSGGTIQVGDQVDTI
ncbi:MAG: MOSC domain-containing protein [Phycisphaerales bacterium]|nr:MOSC domain-containing protein [Phycisphaerales bacterium]